MRFPPATAPGGRAVCLAGWEPLLSVAEAFARLRRVKAHGRARERKWAAFVVGARQGEAKASQVER